MKEGWIAKKILSRELTTPSRTPYLSAVLDLTHVCGSSPVSMDGICRGPNVCSCEQSAASNRQDVMGVIPGFRQLL